MRVHHNAVRFDHISDKELVYDADRANEPTDGTLCWLLELEVEKRKRVYHGLHL